MQPVNIYIANKTINVAQKQPMIFIKPVIILKMSRIFEQINIFTDILFCFANFGITCCAVFLCTYITLQIQSYMQN